MIAQIRFAFLAACFLSTGPSLAQKVEKGKTYISEAEISAVLNAVVDGKPEAAIKNLRAALESASETEKPRISSELAKLLKRVGQQGKDSPTVGDTLQGTTKQERKKASDPLLKLVRDLDTRTSSSLTWYLRSPAYKQLRGLGSLAVPSLLAHLDELGLFGIKAALNLLVANPRPELQVALERMLKAKDPVRNALAADVLVRL